MVKNWRPEKWDKIVREECYDGADVYREIDTFEAGFDACLGALKGSGIRMGNYHPINRTVVETATFLNQCKDGWLVFIPDEEAD